MLQRGDTDRVFEMLLAGAKSAMANRWRYAGYRIATFAPPGLPFDPAVVARFRSEIDPDVAFLWMRHVWISPAGTEHCFDYHVIASASENCIAIEEDEDQTKRAVPPHRDFQHGVLQPYFGKRVRPHSYIEILHSRSRYLPKKILGVFDPLSMRHFHKYREITYLHDTVKRKDLNKQEVEGVYERIRKIDSAWQAESDYRWDHDWNYLAGLVNKLDARERAEILGGAQRRANYIGHALPPEVAAMLRRAGVPAA